jgi:hypothetical protein
MRSAPGANVIKLFTAVIYHHPIIGNTVILCYKAMLPWKLPWNGSKLSRYFNPRENRVKSTEVIYRGIAL